VWGCRVQEAADGNGSAVEKLKTLEEKVAAAQEDMITGPEEGDDGVTPH
jgi:hypothetical protein